MARGRRLPCDGSDGTQGKGVVVGGEVGVGGGEMRRRGEDREGDGRREEGTDRPYRRSLQLN